MRRYALLLWPIFFAACGNSSPERLSAVRPTLVPITLTVRIENIATKPLQTSAGPRPVLLSPGVFVQDVTGPVLFVPGTTASAELERLAGDGDPNPLHRAILTRATRLDSGVFQTPSNATEPALLAPGAAYEFVVNTLPGDRIAFVLMFAQSNDVFVATPPAGLALFDQAGQPMHGDITASLGLWDAGTEVNEEPGTGANQTPRQPARNSGSPEHAPIRPISDLPDGFLYPSPSQFLRVEVRPL